MNRSKQARRRQRQRQSSNRSHTPRRGVLLLVVLSMLVLFLLIGTTFLITSGQYRTQMKVADEAVRATFQPADLLERALMQLVRDTNNANSVIRHHSLLRDLYGVDGFVGRITMNGQIIVGTGLDSVTREGGVGLIRYDGIEERIAPRYAGVDVTAAIDAITNPPLGPTRGQLVEFYVADVETTFEGDATRLSDHNAVGLEFDRNGIPVEHRMSQVDGYYDGSLLTMLDGPCRGQTVRVVSYDHIYTSERLEGTGANAGPTTITVSRWRVMAPKRANGESLELGTLAGATPGLALTDFVDGGNLGYRFMVNGRPFNGAGVGYNPLALSHDLLNGQPSPRLSAVETLVGNVGNYGMEVALAPNAVQFVADQVNHLQPNQAIDPFSGVVPSGGYVSLNTGRTNPLYPTFAGPGDSDESYDAPDTQNMALASQALQPRLRGRVVNAAGVSLDPDAYYPNAAAPAYLDLEGVTIPSFHRPALANFWFHRLFNSGWLSGLSPADRVRAILSPYDDTNNGLPRAGLDENQAKQIALIKRKFMLRPLREDHPDFDGSNPLSTYSTAAIQTALSGNNLVNNGEITFPFWEAVGPWDVDNDGDGVPDSVWVDVGLPVQQTEDGRWYKPLVAMLVEDLDGRLNLNVHGSNDDVVSNGRQNTPSNQQAIFDFNLLDASENNGVTLRRNLAQDYANYPNFPDPVLQSSNQLPGGSGWGVAEVSLRSILSPTLPLDDQLNPANFNFQGNPQYDDYARLLGGRPAPTAGRNVDEAVSGSVIFGRYGSSLIDSLTTTDRNGNPLAIDLTAPGRTYIANATNPIASTRDPRTPLEFLGYPEYLGQLEEASGFTSTPDLGGRYAVGLSAAGAKINEARSDRLLSDPLRLNRIVPVMHDSPYELDVSSEARRLAPVSADAVRLSYDPNGDDVVDTVAAPLVDDAPFSPAELERILRAFDSDAEKLPDRLWEIVDGFDPDKLVAQEIINRKIRRGDPAPISSPNPTDPDAPNSLDNVIAAGKAAVNRRVVTTESFDLPVPNENWADRLALGADGIPGVPVDDLDVGLLADDDDDGLTNEGDEAVIGFNPAGTHAFSNGATPLYNDLYRAGCDDYVVVMRADPPASPRMTDFLRYRVTLELLRKEVIDATAFFAGDPATRQALDRHINEILTGANRPSNLVASNNGRPALFSYGGLLAPELLAGLRMNLNRPFGDGRDNNGNGVVDEPEEAGEPYLFDPNFGNNGNNLVVTQWLDLNKDGLLDQDIDGDRTLYIDADADGRPDRFDPEDLVDVDGAGPRGPEPVVDHLWIDANDNGSREANEFRPFDYTRGVDANGRGGYVDIDTDGVFTRANDRGIRDDARMARQLYARHLYCLMLALTDENYLAPYDSNDPQVVHYINPLSGTWRSGADLVPNDGASIAFWLAGTLFGADHTQVQALPADETRRQEALTEARRLALQKLTRRKIAQWAINVVDFRDPDAIQTPFEYDENPWDGWNVVDTQGTPDGSDDVVYPLDGELATDENYTQLRLIDGTGITAPGILVNQNDRGSFSTDPASIDATRVSLLDRTRGVVWGAERPEALLTEGMAWHDRRLTDEIIPASDNNEGDGGTVETGDDDLDQLHKPKGYVYLEAFNPWSDKEQQPNEFYSHVDRDGTLVPFDGIRFDRLSNRPADRTDPTETRSPVWRLACVEEHPLLRNATLSEKTAKALSVLSGVIVPVDHEASDDPAHPNNESLTTNGVHDYLDIELGGEPWMYKPLVPPTPLTSPGVNYGNSKSQKASPLELTYYEWWSARKLEALLALNTVPANIDPGVSDADGLAIAVGIIETTPRMADPSFPTFDRFAQPDTAAQSSFLISSRVDGENVGTEEIPNSEKDWAIQKVDRTILLKPTRFIERVFYMAGPNSYDALVSGGSVGQPPKGGVDLQTSDELDRGPKTDPAPDLVRPGYRIPDLSYDVPISNTRVNTPKLNRPDLGVTDTESSVPPGVVGKPEKGFTVRISKFASLDLLAGQHADRLNPIELAPLLPGRRAVIGTSGPVYELANPDDPVPATFTGDDAQRLYRRFSTLVSQTQGTKTNPEKLIDLTGTGESIVADSKAGIRRFEMIPSPNSNDHQFAVRMNGATESTSVLSGPARDEAFNLTVGPAVGGNLTPFAPVISIPIDHFSISEPLDEYLVRQQELDPELSRPFNANRNGRRSTKTPAEGFFEDGAAEGTDSLAFDEPFDLLPELIENQTTPNYRAMHLERLANPLMPWNPPPMRVTGEPNVQHDPALPVNPYLPVDAQALDVTAFNSYSGEEGKNIDGPPAASNEYAHVPTGTASGRSKDDYGPEERHRTQRTLPNPKTAIGFASNERDRLIGPFVSLWNMQPSRLLWRQSQGATISDLLYELVYNTEDAGYTVTENDQVKTAGGNIKNPNVDISGDPTADPQLGFNSNYNLSYDQNDLVTTYKAHVVDFPWQMTLGFASRLAGEFYTASGLRWADDTNAEDAQDPAVEGIDLDLDGRIADLLGAAEVNIVPADADGDGIPDEYEIAETNPGKGRPANPGSELDNATTPAFAWPNRPFASAGELLQVPAWGGSRMLSYYSTFNWLHTQMPGYLHDTQVNPYNGEATVMHDGKDYELRTLAGGTTFDGDFANDGGGAASHPDNDAFAEEGPTNAMRFRETLGHFGHLLNFFQTARYPAFSENIFREVLFTNFDGATRLITERYSVPQGAPHFYRVLDYVHVPSRFVATDTLLNPDVFGEAGMQADDPRADFSAPFNRIDRYREPGRVNLNTIVGRRDANEAERINPIDGSVAGSNLPRLGDYWSETYDGLMHRVKDASLIDYNVAPLSRDSLVAMGHLGPAWRDVALSRRGYVQSTFDPRVNPLEELGGESFRLHTATQNQVDYSPRRMHPAFPTFFANPFRAPGEGANVPLAHMVQTGVDATMLRAHPLSPGADGAWGRRGVDDFTVQKATVGNTIANRDGIRDDAGEAGVLTLALGASATVDNVGDRLMADVVLSRFDANGVRGTLPDTFLEDAFVTGLGDPNPRDLSPVESSAAGVRNTEISKRVTPVALFSGAALEPSLDTERNPTMRYQPIQRMASLATTRSNVYAAWITIGFFEVKQAQEAIPALTDGAVGGNTGRYFLANGDFKSAALRDEFFRVYPDGWTLGEELDFETGQNRRHRGFYVIDRSRPVAFRPGEDANVAETILLRRRIE